MADEQQPAQVETSETPIEAIPTDYREYDHWRRTGELPAKAQPAAAEPATTPQAKTEPQSGADDHQQPEEDDETGRGRGGSRQRKIDKLTRENEELRRQLAAGPKPAEEPKAPAPVEPPGKPRLANYKSLEEYQEALTDWKFDQREAAKKAADARDAAVSAEKKLQTEWDSRQETVRSNHQDYDDAIKAVAIPEGPGVMAARQAMLEDEAGPEVLYHLATHPDDLKRIAALPPASAAREIGRLSAVLSPPSSGPANGKPKTSSAPKPPPTLSRPARTSSESILDEDLARTDYAKWERLRVAQLKGK